MSPEWHIITSEYPPQSGGVSDYTRIVAEGLAQSGDEVHVWCPPAKQQASTTSSQVSVYRELGRFRAADWRRLGKRLDQRSRISQRILVQYVPHGYGYRSMNVLLCLWLWKRAVVNRDRIEIVVHEPFLEFKRERWRQSASALVHRLMTLILLQAAKRIWTTIPEWTSMWRPYALGRRVEFKCLPVPSTISVVENSTASANLRIGYAPNCGFVVGHFSTYDKEIRRALQQLVPTLLSQTEIELSVLLMGRGSKEMRQDILAKQPHLNDKLFATGELPATQLSIQFSSCDLMVQPYPDGVSSRRTSVMAALAHGVPVVSTSGQLTDESWVASQAIALAPAFDHNAISNAVIKLLKDDVGRLRIAASGRNFYQDRFDVERLIATLRHSEKSETAPTQSLPAAAQL